MKTKLSWLLAGLFAMTTAASAAPSPATTGEFLELCRHDKKACHEQVSLAEIAMAFFKQDVMARTCIPSRLLDEDMDDVRVNMMVSWLRAHTEYASSTTQDGIAAATLALWPATQKCRDENAVLENARHPDTLPKTAGAFARVCAKEPAAPSGRCYERVLQVKIAETMREMRNRSPSTWCDPKTTDATYQKVYVEQTQGVVRWITAHPAVEKNPRDATIAGALRALYPCKR